MEKRKTALVLSGGGARGAYEIGVWQALRELGIRIDMVVGTSVGAINGAMICQDAFDLTVSLWKELRTDMVLNIKENDIIAYVKEFLTNGGADPTGLKKILKKYVDEKAIRESSIDYGIVTVELPSMAPHYMMKNQIKNGKMIDYILASAACFPAFKSYEIDHKKYIDGGYFDNLPIKMAVDKGATHIIAVDLDAMGKKRPKDFEGKKNIKLIQSPWDLGNVLIFDLKNSNKIMRLGSLETLKSYGVYDGYYYTFVKGEFNKRTLKAADLAAKIFDLNMEIIYLKSIFNKQLKSNIENYTKNQSKNISSESFTEKIMDNIIKAKSTFNQKWLTLTIADSLKKEEDEKNIFLTKPAIKLLKDELLAANYIVKEELI
ncbi:patatin-like phospholipase family protein [Anaerovorax odorimutans]|uniref:patatin-like phospholipase family protein n=1 Tax=Anaerovorax odorimutans TaxID=109327 RepID=UPI000401C61C|nr:patatin-like phospholipase family protein [Anaerovorax odorimutans]